MLGDAVLYAASRATHDAIDNVSRRLAFMAVAAVFLVGALVLGLIATYLLIEPRLGALQSVALIGGGCFLVALIALSAPWISDKYAAWRRAQTTPAQAAVAAVNQEAREAVDYFGALQVVATAFMFGLGAARRLKH